MRVTSTTRQGPRVALIGDVGWEGLYHLGDEAMTEAAIGQLQSRGISDITIIAAEAAPAKERYGVDAIARFGFGTRWGRKRLDERYETLLSEINKDFAALPKSDPAHNILKLVRESDAVVIAGGGNITSRYLYHVYERSLITKLANRFNKPLLLTSQTIGPAIDKDHREIVAEILGSAAMIGAREPATYRLIAELIGSRTTTYRALDDAFHLRATASDYERVAALQLGNGYAVASVSPYVPNPFWSEEEYFERMASILDATSMELDATVFLVPHAGSPLLNEQKHDQVSHARVITTATSDRIRPLPVLTARECLGVMAGASVAISTRYHPIILGQSVGVPTISIGVDAYSFVRMHGAQENFGTEVLHLAARHAAPDTVTALARRLVDQSAQFKEHIEHAKAVRSAESTAWWDALASTINGSSAVSQPSFSDLASIKLAGVSRASRSELAAYNEMSVLYESLQRERSARIQAQKEKVRAENERDKQHADRARAELENRSLRTALTAANSRRAVRIADGLGGIVRMARRKP